MKRTNPILLAMLFATLGCVSTPPPLPPRPPVMPPEEVEYSNDVFGGSDSVKIIFRSNWAKTGPKLNSINMMGRISRITIHHDAMFTTETSRAWAANRIRGIQRAHFSRGWADIGYHFVIDPNGRIWEARPLKYQGAHVSNHNEGNIGIVVLGDFDQQAVNSAQKISLKALVDHFCKTHRIPKTRIYTHGELNTTACPGKNLQAYVNELRK